MYLVAPKTSAQANRVNCDRYRFLLLISFSFPPLETCGIEVSPFLKIRGNTHNKQLIYARTTLKRSHTLPFCPRERVREINTAPLWALQWNKCGHCLVASYCCILVVVPSCLWYNFPSFSLSTLGALSLWMGRKSEAAFQVLFFRVHWSFSLIISTRIATTDVAAATSKYQRVLYSPLCWILEQTVCALLRSNTLLMTITRSLLSSLVSFIFLCCCCSCSRYEWVKAARRASERKNKAPCTSTHLMKGRNSWTSFFVARAHN